MVRALWDEVHDQQWGHVEELLATTVELLHAIYRLTWSSGSGKKYPGKPLTWPRPEREPDEVVEEVVEQHVTIHTWRRALMGGGRPDGL